MYRHDIIAQICYARRLAEKLYHVARMIDLPGGHLVSHERTEEVFPLPNRSDKYASSPIGCVRHLQLMNY